MGRWLLAGVALLAVAASGCFLPPAPEVRFEPDMVALAEEFCTTGGVTLPVPRFDDVRFVGPETSVSSDEREGCAGRSTWSETAEQHITLDVASLVLPSGNAIDAGGSLMLSPRAVYGIVSFQAPEGEGAKAGPYEVDFDAIPGKGGSVKGTVSWLRETPGGHHENYGL